MPKFFITGATGFIGGDALYTFFKAHPEWEIAALVRNSEKGAKVRQAYPNVRLVTGELDSADVIEMESQKADIVIRKLSRIIRFLVQQLLIFSIRLRKCRARRLS